MDDFLHYLSLIHLSIDDFAVLPFEVSFAIFHRWAMDASYLEVVDCFQYFSDM